MAITKKDANAKYDKLRAQLKKGDISKEAFKAASNRIYEMYHGDANKATRNAPKAKPAAKAKPKVNNQSNKDGTYGKSLPSNPKLKSNTNRRHSLMTKGAMVGEDVKPKKRPNRKSRYSGGTSSTSRTAGGRALNRSQRRRRGR